MSGIGAPLPPFPRAQFPHTLFVWDFDWTVINCNSDEYVPCQYLGEDRTGRGFRELYGDGLDWHACVESMVERARNEGGASLADVLDAARRMPYLSEVRGALDDIRDFAGPASDGIEVGLERNCEASPVPSSLKRRPAMGQMILSDGNTLFIQAFLEANGLSGHFTHGVMTNVGTIDDDGRLTVVHQSARYGGHDCRRCARSPNLCKTQALTDALNRLSGNSHDDGDDGEDEAIESTNGSSSNTSRRRRPRIVYIGDGANDACPALSVMTEGDVLLARTGTRRRDANGRSGPETDEEARERVSVVSPDDDGTTTTKEKKSATAPFGILAALRRAAEGEGLVPRCRVLEWSTGAELRCLVRKCLEEETEG